MNFSILTNRVIATFTMVLMSLSIVGSAIAQSGTTGISGMVTDQNGAAVPGASVKLMNPSTGFERTATTSDDGKFNFPTIPPATYRIEVEAANFKKLVNSNVKVLVDSPIEVNLTLEPGAVTAVVDVTANTIDSIVNNQDATVGNNFVGQQIRQLPTELRRVADLLSLQPGVTIDGYVNGGRSDQANITLDGVDINDQQTGGRTSQFQRQQETVLRITAEAVDEFRITTTNPNANQGRSSGAQISLVTRGGTNDFHGSLFYFHRPTDGSANTFFNNLDGIDRGDIRRHIYGGSLGGPIWKDRVFFFYSYEGQQERRPASICQVVPLAHMGQGQLRYTGTAPGDPQVRQRTLTTTQLNQIFPEVMINPAAVAVFASAASRYPSNSDCDGDGVNTGGFRFNSPTTDNENTHIARFDWNVRDNHSIMFRGNIQDDLEQGASAFPDTPATGLWEHPYGFAVAHNWTISNNMINNFRYGLTRQAFSSQGDSAANSIGFRFVYTPLFFSRTLSRVTPVQNFTNDFSWVKGDHTLQFGGNVRIIRNQRVDFANAFDDAVTNPSFYNLSGAVVSNAFNNAGYVIAPSDISIVQNAATALIGRFSQYSGNFTFDLNGNVVPAGTPVNRNFATEEYDAYVQDVWKPFQNLTLTLGLRYALSRPVYEKNGYQVVPKERLGDFFERRVAAANAGRALNDLITFEKAGPVNNGQGFYSMDWNNWQPRVAAAWSPNFDNRFLRALFGKEGDSVIRGGFAITNDQFGGQLAVSFDQLSLIGFTSSTTVAANTYDISNCGTPGTPAYRCAPRFTGFGQDIRSLPRIPPPVQRFTVDASPACLSGEEWCPQRIELGLDGTIVSPTHYSWNVSYGRKLPFDMYVEATYTGRKARNLFAGRDVMALNNIVDPATGMDWYTAAGMVHDLRAANVPFDSPNVNIPYFTNIFGPGMADRVRAIILREFGFDDPTFTGLNPTQVVLYLAGRDGYDILDWTFTQLIIDDAGPVGRRNLFFHPQFAAYSSFSTIAYSDYHGATFSLRQRLGDMVSFDVNYTWSKSLDNASGLNTGGLYGSQFILNPLRPQDNYAPSDFDTRHVVNGNFLFDVPVGKGKKFFTDMNRWVDALVGGWQFRGLFRWNTGQPTSTPFDRAQWATNWNVQSSGTRIRPVTARAVRSTQNFFADPRAAYRSFRNARPGETGERNAFRVPGYSVLDLGLAKSFSLPWYENHKVEVRWEVFNVMNYQYFDDVNYTRTTYGLGQDSDRPTSSAPANFGRIFTAIQGSARRMQFGVRYSF